MSGRCLWYCVEYVEDTSHWKCFFLLIHNLLIVCFLLTAIKTYFIVGRKDGMSSPLQPQSPKLSPSTETANPDEGGEKTSPDKEQGPVTDVQIVVDVPTDDEHQSPVRWSQIYPKYL